DSLTDYGPLSCSANIRSLPTFPTRRSSDLIRAGEGVLAPGYAANRDPRAFENADELDIERGARHHVAFGFGPHQCLGQNLARMRSEEHTSELQSPYDLVCRLLLQKKQRRDI